MAITVYGTLADFMLVLPSTAWGARTVDDAQQAIVDASDMFNDSFRGRFPLPFASVGRSVIRNCQILARNLFLGGRGFDPAAGSDAIIVGELSRVEVWLDKVQRRVLFPDVTIDPTAVAPTSLDASPAVQQPIAISSSVVDMNGRRAHTRCW